MASAGPNTERIARAPDLPQVFGRYLLLKRLSRGGMGEIFIAKLGEIQGFEKPVIIKKVLPQLAADEEFVKRFIDEAQVAIKLTHANIAPVYEVGKVDGDYFLAIEYVEGRDLRRLVARCAEERFRLPPELCLYIVRNLANGLAYAHRRTDTAGNALALVHCDISPPNVMVSFEGEVKIIDFGIAKSALRVSGSNPNVGFGKFGYMAPEQLLKGGVVDRRTDIYAAGVVLYELLTGERLFQFPEGADYRQIARIVTRGEFVPPSQRVAGIDPSFDPIVARALASKAADRYQSAEELRDAISAKLSQMSPTISSDALALLMRRLFAGEIVEERALVAQTRAVDVEEYRDELAGSMGHTVTFARAGLLARRASSQQAVPAVAGGLASRWRSLLIGGAASLVLAGVGLSTWLVVRPRPAPLLSARTRSLASTSSVALPPHGPGSSTSARPRTMSAVSLSPPPAPPGTPPPMRTGRTGAPDSPVAISPPPVLPIPAARGGAHRPFHRPTGTVASTQNVVHTGAQQLPQLPPQGRPAGPGGDEEAVVQLKAQVEAKFQAVNRDYERFRSENGDVLVTQYNAMINEVIHGPKGRLDHWTKLNSLIDALRRDMTRVRTGG